MYFDFRPAGFRMATNTKMTSTFGQRRYRVFQLERLLIIVTTDFTIIVHKLFLPTFVTDVQSIREIYSHRCSPRADVITKKCIRLYVYAADLSRKSYLLITLQYITRRRKLIFLFELLNLFFAGKIN